MRDKDIRILELFMQLTEDEKDDALSYAVKLIEKDEQAGCQ